MTSSSLPPLVGIMQGRLSPPIGGRIQSFPVQTWADEFPRARQAGLASIEWIYEAGTERDNPLGTDEGLARIRAVSAASGVAVRSICADWYMTHLLLDPAGRPVPGQVDHLGWLLERAARLGIAYVVLPFVDASSMRTAAHLQGLRDLLASVLPKAEAVGIELHLETDLPPARLGQVLAATPHPFLKANYDIGNSAALGYDPTEELAVIGSRLGSVHIKDRVRGGATVPLGTGAADFAACFRAFARAGLRYPYILQAARGEPGQEVAWAIQNRRFVEERAATAAREVP